LTYLNEVTFPVRVYYEDTDAGGVVYHANYLCFMERARTEWLRALGFEHDTLATTLNILFVVGGIDIQYRKPARLNDALTVKTRIETLGRASLAFKQEIWLETANNSPELLTTASVKVVCVAVGTFRATIIPTQIRELLQ